jgi:hypothetical protein
MEKENFNDKGNEGEVNKRQEKLFTSITEGEESGSYFVPASFSAVIYARLRHYAAYSGNYLRMFRDKLLAPSLGSINCHYTLHNSTDLIYFAGEE